MLTEILVTVVAFILVLYFLKSLKAKEKTRLPPGPWGLPIVGHIPFLGTNPAKTFTKWKYIYGPIFSVNFGSYPTVVFNDLKMIKEAFSLEVFSGRPQLTNWATFSGGKGIVLSEGTAHAEQRRFALKTMKEFEGSGKSAIEFYVQQEISILLESLQQKIRSENAPGNAGAVIKIKDFFKVPVINSFWETILGKRFEEKDPKLKYFTSLVEKLTNASVSIVGALSLFFPWFSTLLSFLGLNAVVSEMRSFYEYMEQEIEQKRGDHVSGQPKHFTHSYFDQVAQTTDPMSSFYKSTNVQPVTTVDIFLAAIDTTTKSLDWLLLYMAREPEIQRRIQKEIDTVIGIDNSNSISNSRRPTITDRAQMPYTEAVIHELLRITSLAPLGVFRRTLEDVVDFYGYTIPKNTMVIANQFGVHHDPERWPEPEAFKPDRFLDEGGKLNKSTRDLIPFSFGRRGCAGERLARDQLFVLSTCFFQKFTVSCTENVPSVEGVFGIVFAPQDFELNIVERKLNI